jgi:hypothetical protein
VALVGKKKPRGGRRDLKLTKPAIREIESALEKGMVCEISCSGQLVQVNVHPRSADISFPFPYMVKARETIAISISDGTLRVDAILYVNPTNYAITGIKGYEVGEP